MSVITVTATVEASNVPPRVRLNVADTGSPAFSTTTVTRLNPDGTTTNVRTPLGGAMPLTSGSALLYDYETPYGQAVSYSSLDTPANVTTQVTLDSSVIRLIHPGAPTLSQPLDLLPGSLMEESYTGQQAVFWPMGRSTPVVINDGARKSARSTIVTLTQTVTGLVAMRALLDDMSPLLLNIPVSMGMGFDTCWISVQDIQVSRLTDVNADPSRSITLPFTVVGRPAGGTQSQRTLTDLLVYPTLQAVQSAYPTFAAVLAGP